ncbi:hypothetical protein PR202_gb23355 [Eleusine coracana subsp. coracana]|uniref:Uncharacterized protein n=1 Tax=Eleusine coracana subsp. coracana TaxID=191504 RepID=A0AAV5FIN2_ELECO|nr:hypothetical protein PR202_gb23355 [Eleusine coracana subsp. coracana]
MTSTTAPSASTTVRLPRKFHLTRRASTTFFPSTLTHTSPPSPRPRHGSSPPRHATVTSCSDPSSRNRHRVVWTTCC